MKRLGKLLTLLPSLLLAAALFMAAGMTGTLQPTGLGWVFPIGTTPTIYLQPGLQQLYGMVQIGIAQRNWVEIIGGSTGNPSTIRASGADRNVGLKLLTKGVSPMTLYPEGDSTSAVRVTNASQSVYELAVNTSDHVTRMVSTQVASGAVLGFVPLTLGMERSTVSGTVLAAGAAGARIELVCGTLAGTLKLIAFAGTNTVSPATIADNMGSGASGC